MIDTLPVLSLLLESVLTDATVTGSSSEFETLPVARLAITINLRFSCPAEDGGNH